VLLFLHGGLPEYFLTERYPTQLENDFTVVWWEQRGAGLSYSPRIPPETMTLEQFVADTLSVTDYLRNRFSQEKIYLMAHSGGTFIGLQVAARAPQVYCAYVGVAQMVHQLESERRAYEYMHDGGHAGGVPGGARPGHAQSRRRHGTRHDFGASRRRLAIAAEPALHAG
jgi:pimeloyl-ACP methyl ester carboxylesterase